QDREEAVAEARAASWSAWHGLVERGKDPVEVGVDGIAHNAIRYVKNGRRLGNRHCGRGAMDVGHRRAQRVGGFRVVSLDQAIGSEGSADSLRQWLVADYRVGPADEAGFR